ncbi:hypothetical protein [Loktanella salsilacus]|uniref:hypothetical protein n=1 Tax=Loktanella salsilacus TaxID=195913 RepID=UPI0030013F40
MGQDEEQKANDRQEELLDAELALFTGEEGISLDLLAMGSSPEMAIQGALDRAGGGSG